MLLVLVFRVGGFALEFGLGLSGREYECGEYDLRGFGVGSLSSISSVFSYPGRGGATSSDALRLPGLEDPNEDFLGLESGIPKRLCSFLRAAEALGVVGLDEGGPGGSTPFGLKGIGSVDGGRFFGRGVPGVIVVFVAVVVDDRGRDWIRVAGLDGVDWPILSTRRRLLGRSGIGSSGSIDGVRSWRERDRERVRERAMKLYSCKENDDQKQNKIYGAQRYLLCFPILIFWRAGRRLGPFQRCQHKFLEPAGKTMRRCFQEIKRGN